VQYKILLLGQDWLQTELQAQGHEVVSASITNRRCNVFITLPGLSFVDLLSLLPRGFIPDRIIYWDDSTVPWVTGLEETNIPKLFFAVDTHQHHHWHPQFSAVFDKTLVAHKDFLPLFSSYSTDALWMPLWATVQALPPAITRDLDVVFVGTVDPVLHPERAKFFKAVGDKVPLTILSGDYLEPYSRAKIVLNQVVNGDLNFRVFEVLSAGALLVTPRIGNGLLELFKDREEIVCYENGNAADAIEKIQHYLKSEREREEIAKKGNEKALTLHQSKNRVATVVAELEKLRPATSGMRAYGAAFAYLAGFVTCQNQGISWGRNLFHQGIKALSGVKNLESKEQTGTAVIYAHFQKEFAGIVSGIEFLKTLQSNSPNNRGITLSLIRDLLASNHREDAIEEAKKISDNPESICMQAADLLARELS
jgi:hypothetical protein